MMSSARATAPPCFLFAGGGTGGHLYPGIAIAEEIRKKHPAVEIVFVGNAKNIEGRIIPGHGFRFFPIWVGGFKRSLSLSTLVSAVKVIVALVQSFFVIRGVKPRVVVGTGGYVCGPPVFVASLLGIPTLIQEQNSFPGVTTRLLARRVNEVHVSFERTLKYLRRTKRVFVTGNPTRESVGSVDRRAGAERLQVDPGKFTVLVVGGSKGARSVNNAILGVAPELAEMEVQVVWSCGTDDYDRILAGLRRSGVGVERWVRALRYIEDIECAYAAADLVVCRAGATTLAEVTRAGLPSVLVPYPYAAADHQTENAKAMEEAGASVVVRDADLATQILPILRDLIRDPARMSSMGERARSLAAPHATEILAEAVIRLAGE